MRNTTQPGPPARTKRDPSSFSNDICNKVHTGFMPGARPVRLRAYLTGQAGCGWLMALLVVNSTLPHTRAGRSQHRQVPNGPSIIVTIPDLPPCPFTSFIRSQRPRPRLLSSRPSPPLNPPLPPSPCHSHSPYPRSCIFHSCHHLLSDSFSRSLLQANSLLGSACCRTRLSWKEANATVLFSP